jgi:hypothetical protein
MPSPFPGMNPYFEQPNLWRGIHGLILAQITFTLGPRLDPRYYVEYEESVYIDQPPAPRRRPFAVADVGVARGDTSAAGGTATLATPTGTAPVTARVRIGAIKRKHRWLTIRDTQSREVVTVLEVLSPSNKRGEDRGQYLRKRRHILRSAAHFVEIDLLRGGERMPTDDAPDSDYRILVSRQPERPDVQVWPVGLRQLLPPIPVPLRTGEPDVMLDLKPILDAVYDGGVYYNRVYASPPDPPLSPADADWARAFVPAG